MKVNATQDAGLFEVIDLDTGEVLQHVVSADVKTGEYTHLVIDMATGKIAIDVDTGEPMTLTTTGNIEIRRIVSNTPAPASQSSDGQVAAPIADEPIDVSGLPEVDATQNGANCYYEFEGAKRNLCYPTPINNSDTQRVEAAKEWFTQKAAKRHGIKLVFPAQQ